MKKKVLLVEDDEAIIELLSEVLQDLGEYQLLHAADGLEALRIIREHHPDLVLLDILIPELTGFEVCQTVKSDPDTSHIKVIMISGMAQNADILKAKEVGAEAFITKPFSIAELVTQVEELLNSN